VIQDQHSFGNWLRIKRKSLDLTQARLADRVGCSVSTIRKLEDEERRPSVQIAELLADIFNIPTNEREAFLQFARGNLLSAPDSSNVEVDWRASIKASIQHPRTNLPATFTSLVGRSKDITAVHKYLLNPNIRLVTLIGPPGIGKTRLSVESAKEALTDFPEGVFFVPLSLLDHPTLITLAILQALGYVEKNDLPAEVHLTESIGNKRMLLVLDNCEHLIEVVSLLAASLLSTCPHLKILSTSREALRITGEWIYSVPALDMPKENSMVDIETISNFPALVLFAERARAVRSDFAFNTENIQAIASICAQLDGLPLAIELIASRIRLESPQTLLERLNDRLILTADGIRDLPTRQKSLNNVVGWSYNLLTPEEQKLFSLLSVFMGGFTLDAAEAIFSHTVKEKSVNDLIASLLDKSLLQQVEGNPDRPRFTMLKIIQRFALNCLRNAGLETTARQEHLTYLIELAEQGDREIRGPTVIEWVSRIESEHNNIRAALEWSVLKKDAEAALRLLVAVGWFWQLAGHFREARDWLYRIRELSGISDHPVLYARLLNHIGRVSWTQDRMDKARLLLMESQSLCISLKKEGEPILAEAWNWFGLLVLSSERDIDQARLLIQKGLELFQKWEIRAGVTLSMLNLGIVEIQAEHYDLALSLLEKSSSLARQSGDLIILARTSRYLGNLYLRQRNYENASVFFEEHLRIDTALKFWDGIGHAYGELGDLFRYQGDDDQAEQFYKESLRIHYEHGLEPDIQYLQSLVLTALRRKDYPLASQRIIDCYNLSGKLGEKVSAYGFFVGLAAVAAGLNRSESAARLNGMAQAILESTSYWHDLIIDRAEFDRHIQMARDQLGEVRFTALTSEGRAMEMKVAIEYALELATKL
jgi:predicted ATPase/transcriptional regulator with XRE-family HTH domain